MTMLLRRENFMYYVNTSLLSYLLTGKYPADSNLVKNIKDGIEGLGKKSTLILSQSNTNNEWIIDAKDMVKDRVDKSKESETGDSEKKQKDFYVGVENTEIHKILLFSDKYYTRSISLLRFYIYILSTIHKKKDDKYTGVGFTSIQNMVDATGYNKKTISSYLRSLVELELLYIYKAKDFVLFDDGGIVEISHTYGRFKDKELIEKIGKEHEEEYGMNLKSKHVKIKKDNSDKTRGLSQMFRHAEDCLKEGKDIPYNKKKCKEIYIAMLELNEKNEANHPDRIKDLSIFSNYDFYKGEQNR